MNIWPFKKSFPKCLSFVQIELFESIKNGDQKVILSKINKYNEIIKSDFVKWQNAPIEIRGSKFEKWYANGLIGIADTFRRCGDNSLIDQLMGKQEDNPILKWQNMITSAQKELDENRPENALIIIEQIIPEIENLSGTAVDKFLPICYGIVGVASFKMGKIDNAIKSTTMALGKCKENKDQDGIAVYTSNLKMIKGN